MFHYTFKHFEDMSEDQFDFHSYCLRKMTLRSYVEMLRMEDHLLHHMQFSRAAWGAIETYLHLAEIPKRQAQVCPILHTSKASSTVACDHLSFHRLSCDSTC